MKNIKALFTGFRAKITIVLIFSMLFAGALSDFLIYRYALDQQFNQLRNKLMMIARVSSLMVDTETLASVPLSKDGINSAYFKDIAGKLIKIKEAAPSIKYIYILKRSGKKGIYNFVVDPEAGTEKEGEPTSYPGDEYDGSLFPEMARAFDAPAADKKLGSDEWGVFLSGYAPIRNADGRTVAILGVDMAADDIYAIQKNVHNRAAFVLLLGIFLAIAIGIFISARITEPLRMLTEGTRSIAKGDLGHQVKVRGNDEIAELAGSFNKMATDLKAYMEELKRTTAEKERLMRELEIAKGIQESFLPQSVPTIGKFDIAVISLAARVVGGDFYDFIPIDENKWGIAVADVSGKGIPASLFMALSRTVLRASTRGKDSIRAAIEKANSLIMEDNRMNMFVTLFYAILDSKKSILRYVNAGHNPAVFSGKKGKDVVLLEAQGVPLGLVEKLNMKETVVKVKKGDVIALYTDGIVEAVNDKREQFQIERLLDTISKNRSLSSKEIIAKIQEELKSFVGDQPQFDDITLMVIKAA